MTYNYIVFVPHSSSLISRGIFSGAIPNCSEMTIKSKSFPTFGDAFGNLKNLMSGLVMTLEQVDPELKLALTLRTSPAMEPEVDDMSALDEWGANVMVKIFTHTPPTHIPTDQSECVGAIYADASILDLSQEELESISSAVFS